MRLLLLSAMLLAAAPASARAPRRPDWKAVITNTDRTRLRDWRVTWTSALDRARANGKGAEIDAAGTLLQPDAGLDGPAIPDGAYRCRTVKVGARRPTDAQFLAAGPFACRVGEGRLVMLDGAQRPGGWLYPFDGTKLLFLGAMTLGDESGFVPYGRDPDRNLIGVVERIGPARWRLVLPQLQWQTLLEVVELVPAG